MIYFIHYSVKKVPKVTEIPQVVICACDRSLAEAEWHSANELLIVFRDPCYGCKTRKQILASLKIPDIQFFTTMK